MPDEVLDEFGEFVIRNFRDKAFQQHEMLQQGSLRAPRLQKIQSELSAMSPDQREVVSKVVTDVIDTALHDILFAFQDAHDRGIGIEVIVKGKNVAALNDMLHGEIQGEVGWVARFSRFPQ